MAIPFLGSLLSALGTIGKGVWNLAKFIPEAATRLVQGVPLRATKYGAGSYGWTSPIGGATSGLWSNLAKYIPSAINLMQGLEGGQAQQRGLYTGEQYIPYQMIRTGFPSMQMPSYSDIIRKALKTYG